MNAETKKAFERLDAAITRLEASRSQPAAPLAGPGQTAEHSEIGAEIGAEIHAEIGAIRSIVDEAIALLDPDKPTNGKGAER